MGGVLAAATVTMISCVAIASAISVAVTVMVAMPGATPVMVNMLPLTETVAYDIMSDIAV